MTMRSSWWRLMCNWTIVVDTRDLDPLGDDSLDEDDRIDRPVSMPAPERVTN